MARCAAGRWPTPTGSRRVRARSTATCTRCAGGPDGYRVAVRPGGVRGGVAGHGAAAGRGGRRRGGAALPRRPRGLACRGRAARSSWSRSAALLGRARVEVLVTRGAVDGLRSAHPLGELLPAVYLEDDLARGFTEGLDPVLAPVFLTLDCLEAYVDPRLTPRDFLPWLAAWVGVDSTRPGRRAGSARWSRRRRACTTTGDPAGLGPSYLELATGGKVELIESGGTRWSAVPGASRRDGECPAAGVVRVSDPTVNRRQVDRAVRDVRPAHLPYPVEVRPLASASWGETSGLARRAGMPSMSSTSAYSRRARAAAAVSPVPGHRPRSGPPRARRGTGRPPPRGGRRRPPARRSPAASAQLGQAGAGRRDAAAATARGRRPPTRQGRPRAAARPGRRRRRRPVRCARRRCRRRAPRGRPPPARCAGRGRRCGCPAAARGRRSRRPGRPSGRTRAGRRAPRNARRVDIATCRLWVACPGGRPGQSVSSTSRCTGCGLRAASRRRAQAARGRTERQSSGRPPAAISKAPKQRTVTGGTSGAATTASPPARWPARPPPGAGRDRRPGPGPGPGPGGRSRPGRGPRSRPGHGRRPGLGRPATTGAAAVREPPARAGPARRPGRGPCRPPPAAAPGRRLAGRVPPPRQRRQGLGAAHAAGPRGRRGRPGLLRRVGRPLGGRSQRPDRGDPRAQAGGAGRLGPRAQVDARRRAARRRTAAAPPPRSGPAAHPRRRRARRTRRPPGRSPPRHRGRRRAARATAGRSTSPRPARPRRRAGPSRPRRRDRTARRPALRPAVRPAAAGRRPSGPPATGPRRRWPPEVAAQQRDGRGAEVVTGPRRAGDGRRDLDRPAVHGVAEPVHPVQVGLGPAGRPQLDQASLAGHALAVRGVREQPFGVPVPQGRRTEPALRGEPAGDGGVTATGPRRRPSPAAGRATPGRPAPARRRCCARPRATGG